jgi:hypothetical protein
MSESDQFRQYAEEALLWAAQSKSSSCLSLYAHGPKRRSRVRWSPTTTQGLCQRRFQAPQRRGPMPWLREDKAFDTVDSAMAHADQSAAN